MEGTDICTLLSIDRVMFEENTDEVLRHMHKDAVSNDDGFALVTCGTRHNHAANLRTMALDPIINYLMVDKTWERFWLHSRYATTSTVNMSTVHGFDAADGWFVMHNGVLRDEKVDSLDVDSRIIPELIKLAGVDAAVNFLMTNETYANVFIVQPETGKWKMIRLETGSLYTDGYGNYATNPLLDINQRVDLNSVVDFDEEVTQPAQTWGYYDYWTKRYPNSFSPRTTESTKTTTLPAKVEDADIYPREEDDEVDVAVGCDDDY